MLLSSALAEAQSVEDQPTEALSTEALSTEALSTEALSTEVLFTEAQFVEPQYGGTLIFGKSGDASTLDPALVTDVETFKATTQVYDNLVQFKYGTTVIEPALAERWEVSQDGLEYTFYLRRGVEFAKTSYFTRDATFTADDVIFSFMRQKDPKHPFYTVGGGTWEYWDRMGMSYIVKDIVKLGDYRVKFILNKPEAQFLANLAMDFAAILSKDYADGLALDGQQEELTQKPVGTGPFVFVQWVKNEHMVFKANINHWNGRPYINTLIMRVITNSFERTSELERGRIHMMDSPDASDLAYLRNDPQLKIIEQVGLNVGYLAFNMEKEPFDNLTVRKAIALAIDRKTLVEAVYGEMGRVAKNPLPPMMWSYNDDIQDHEFNQEKAKELLLEAGYPDGFTADLWAMPVARSYNPNARKVAEMMQADLAKIGITINIVSHDWVTYLMKSKMGEHEMLLLGQTSDNGDPNNFLYPLLNSSKAEKPASNRAFYRNYIFDALIGTAKVSSNTDERTALYRYGQTLFQKEIPWLPIAHSMVFEPMLKQVNGFKLDPLGKRRFKDVWLSR
ncbi:MAG: ABC transporter substrate-binding protein [SAR324 cluster bacterium]|uniref:ABC transporter substrate-binding protein n=1 Tax=SAR324 cluster bacterium TaxID=2024889 RepID=A0A2A4SLI5_9DELT|nr:MAG: ABC transporter substrate-binding protein [SAR324 cluster bacterium]